MRKEFERDIQNADSRTGYRKWLQKKKGAYTFDQAEISEVEKAVMRELQFYLLVTNLLLASKQVAARLQHKIWFGNVAKSLF